MISRFHSVLALSGLCVAAVPAAAQERDVVVTGERPSSEQRAAVRSLTSAITRPVDGQMARFDEPVCADSVGFEDRYARIVVDHIEAAARDAGVEVARPGCRPNITVMMVDSGQKELQRLYKAKPALFRAVEAGERKRLLADSGPVHVITLTEIRDRDGEEVRSRSANGSGGNNSTPMLVVHSVSLINPSTRQDIAGSLVLIDRAAAMGKTLRQIADYAAMRTLARTAPADGGANTILTLFSPGATTPSGLTAFDRTYLKGLYTGPATRTAMSQASSIASGINRANVSARAEERP